ncbi:MAG: ABC transporter ATP-binding protein [Phycisphaerales bacterium]
MTLAFDHVTFGYTDKPVLRAAHASFAPGRVTALVGPNGSGKSTMLRLLAALREPASGSVTLDGAVVACLPRQERVRRLVYVPQQSSVAFDYTCAQIVAMGAHAAGRSDAGVESLLAEVGLGDRASDLFATLSAGQQQRVTLARALAQLGPADGSHRFLLADEPVSAMDPRHAVQSLELIRALAARGIGAVCVLHDLSMALRVCDDVVMLGDSGRVVAAGPVREVLTAPRLSALYGIGFDPLTNACGNIGGFVPAATSS